MGQTRCIVPGCGKLTEKFILPADKRIRKEWLRRCGSPTHKSLHKQAKICPKHFDLACIVDYSGRLSIYSVPSLFLNYVPTGKKEDNFMAPVGRCYQVRPIKKPKRIKVVEITPSARKSIELIRASPPSIKVLCPTKTYSRKRQLDLNNHKTSLSATEISLPPRFLLNVDNHQTVSSETEINLPHNPLLDLDNHKTLISATEIILPPRLLLDVDNHRTSSSAKEISFLERLLLYSDLEHETSHPLTVNTPKKLNNDMKNCMERRYTCQKMLKPALNDSVETCTTHSSKGKMQQHKMLESCKPLEEKIKKELDNTFPCNFCLDMFCSMEDLMRHVNDKHMKIEINEESITKKIKQENYVKEYIYPYER